MSAKAILSASVSAPPAPYVEDVFSTFLYTGNSSTRTITNGIDLAGEGGLVWIKARNSAEIHSLYDTARGANKFLYTNGTQDQISRTDALTSFTSSGFTLGVDGNYEVNTNSTTYCSWTFRKAPKFFDVVTYTGNGAASQTIAHSLGSVPGCMIMKGTSAATNWPVYHRSMDASPQNFYMILDGTTAKTSAVANWGNTSPTSTQFTVGGNNNANGITYVAYLFAHDAGGFGDAGTDNVVSCGSFTTDGNGDATVSLGYEPQWVLYKSSSANGTDWYIDDSMRSGLSDTRLVRLSPNNSNAENSSVGTFTINATASGFKVANGVANGAYIYIAIRRGPMKTPTVGTEVFYPLARTGTGSDTSVTGASFPPDAHWSSIRTSDNGFQKMFFDKLRGANKYLIPLSTAAEGTSTNILNSFDQDGVTYGAGNNANGSSTNYINWMFRRAPGFFDVVAYTGDGTASRQLIHSLDVSPELVISKQRTGSNDWRVVASAIGFGATDAVALNSDSAKNVTARPISAASAATVTLDLAGANVNSNPYIMYLFATLTGVSKVGSYTGTGTGYTVDVNCGFTAGARFVLIKRTDSTGDWFVWDTARGIISGNDPYLLLNSGATEVTGTDYIDPLSTGFQISSTAPAAINASGGTYIFLAIS